MRRRTLSLLAAVLGVALCAPAMAQWKWKDKAGQVQYSDLPPPAGVPEADILQRPAASLRRVPAPVAAPASAASVAPGASAAVAAAPAPKTQEPELEAKRRKAEQEEQAKKKADESRVAALKAENCGRAKSQLRALEDGLRIARVNKDGDREVLDDAQRAEETKRAKAIVASDCR